MIAYIFRLTQPYTFDSPQLNGFVKLAVTKAFPLFLHDSIYFPADAIVYTAVFDESRFLPEKAGKVGAVHLDKGA